MPYGIPSTEEQLEAARDATDSGWALVHVDTCLGCYLTDHHNRPGEQLLGVPVDGSTTVNTVRIELKACAAEVIWQIEGFDWEAAFAAIDAAFADADPNAIFDPSLETPMEESDLDGGEVCEAWFVLTWPVNSEEEED